MSLLAITARILIVFAVIFLGIATLALIRSVITSDASIAKSCRSSFTVGCILGLLLMYLHYVFA